jgi:hypothetical protein
MEERDQSSVVAVFPREVTTRIAAKKTAVLTTVEDLRQVPKWLVHVVALFDPTVRLILPLLDNMRHATSAKAERVLGWRPQSRRDRRDCRESHEVRSRVGLNRRPALSRRSPIKDELRSSRLREFGSE